jgi:hypothetical protein
MVRKVGLIPYQIVERTGTEHMNDITWSGLECQYRQDTVGLGATQDLSVSSGSTEQLVTTKSELSIARRS